MIFNMTITGTSSTKSIVIISIDSGSTVAAYSDAACTTLVKNAVEKSSGKFWITDLINGTYYIKATLNGKETIESYTISEFGVYRFSMTYFRAEITASFPTSCTSVSLTNGTDSYTVPADEISNGTYTFVVTSTGTYTGEATCTNYTLIPDAVTISNDEESVETHYKLWLYNGSLNDAGSSGANCCNDVSGGWSAQQYNATNLYVISSTGISTIYNNTAITLTPFTTFHIKYKQHYSDSKVGISSAKNGGSWRVSTTPGSTSTVTSTLDVSNLNNVTGYVYVYGYGTNTLYSAWFE